MVKLSMILVRNIKFTLLMEVSENVNNVSFEMLLLQKQISYENMLFSSEKLIHHNLLFQDIIILIIILFYPHKTSSNCIFSFNVFLSHLDLQHC